MSTYYLSQDTVRYETGGFWELVSWFLWTDPAGPGATGDLLVPSEERARHHVWDLPGRLYSRGVGWVSGGCIRMLGPAGVVTTEKQIC